MHLRCDFFSDALELSTSMTVLLPQPAERQIGMVGAVRDGRTPVLYLLHGLSDDDTSWLRRSSIERYAADLGLAVVMPQVHRSFYTDQVHGGRYWTFISEELPALLANSFRLSTRREDTFVAGLSMGGYGAVKLALRQPERFAAAGSLSGVLDLSPAWVRGNTPAVFDATWGSADPGGTDDDPTTLVSRADPSSLPRLWLSCGTEDELVETNHSFLAAARSAGVHVDAEFHPGAHEWAYWDTHIQRFLGWLPLGG